MSGREKDRKIDIMMFVGYPDGGKPAFQVGSYTYRQKTEGRKGIETEKRRQTHIGTEEGGGGADTDRQGTERQTERPT